MRTLYLYDLWKASATDDPDLIMELNALSPQNEQQEIYDRFYRDLEFGTGGLRGTIGAGTNRMNIYVIRRATQGLCNYLKSTDLPQSIAIGYDSRNDRFFVAESESYSGKPATVGSFPRYTLEDLLEKAEEILN